MSKKNSTTRNYEPDFAVPPGDTLRETIEHLGIDQRELADRTGLTPKTLNEIIQGKAPLTHQTAVLLERVTNVPARIWNNLEAVYREQLARLEARSQVADDVEWLKRIPTKELIRRGYLEECDDKIAMLVRTLAFFRVATVAAWHEGWSDTRFAFRKSEHASTLDGRLAAWLQIAEFEAEKVEVAPYNKSHFQKAVEDIRSLTTLSPREFVPKMIELCREAGVALCLVPEIPGGKISGAVKWLTHSKAMIALNLRGKKSDLFWFTFFHEAGHILHDSKKETFVDVSYTEDPREQAANNFAKRLLIPKRFDSVLPTLRNEQSIRQFAAEVDLDPGIVVGRLQHEKVIGYNQLNHLKSTFTWSDQAS